MAFNINAHVILQGPKNIQAVTRSIQSQLSSINANVNVNVPKGAQNSLSGVSNKMKTLGNNVKSFNNSSNAMVGNLNRISTSAKSAGGAMFMLGKETALTFKRFAAAGIVTATVFRFATAITEATKNALEFERTLVKLQQITGGTRRDLDGLRKTTDSLAKALGQDANEILEVAQIFAQTGQSIREIKASITTVARSSLAPTFGEMKDTAEGLIAAMNQFGIAAKNSESILGSLNQVSKRFAVESQDIIAAIRRAGGVFAMSATEFKKPMDSLNEFIGLFTAVRSTTRESAETIATGLRTIFTRIQRRGTIGMLRELGINLTDAEGKFVGLFESFRRLSSGLDTLIQKGDAISLSAITEELGGIRQVGKLIPAIKNFNKAEAAFREAQRGAIQGLGKDVELGLTPLIKGFEQLQQRFGSLVRTISESATFKVLASNAIRMANAFLSVSESLVPLMPLLVKFASLKIGSGAMNFFRGFGMSFRGGGGVGAMGANLGGALTGSRRGGPAARGTPPGVITANTTGLKANQTASAANTKAVIANNIATNGLLNVLRGGGLTGVVRSLVPSMTTLKTAIVNLTTVMRSGGLGAGLAARGLGARPGGARPRRGFNRGGIVPGVGSGDTVPAMLEAGEFVIRKSAVQAFGAGNLNKVNKYAPGTRGRGVRKTRRTEQLRQNIAADRLKRNPVFGAGDNNASTEAKALGKLRLTDTQIDALPENDRYGGAFLSPEGASRQLKGVVEKSAIEAELKKSRAFQILSMAKSRSTTGQAIRKEIQDIRSSLVQKTDFSLISRSLSPSVSNNIENDILRGVQKSTRKASMRLSGSTGSAALNAADEANVMRMANIDNVIGNLFEMTLLKAGAPYDPTERDTANAPFDFPVGLGGISKNFSGIPSNIPTDAKTRFTAGNLQSFLTKVKNVKFKDVRKRLDIILDNLDSGLAGLSLDDFSTQEMIGASGKKTTRRNEAKGFLGRRRARRRAAGGRMSGGTDTIPALLTPGEYVVNKSAAQSFGYGNLNRINKYAKGGVVQRFNKGGQARGGMGGGALFALSTLAFDIPLLSQAMKDSAEGVEGAGQQMTMALTSLGISLGFLAFEMKGTGLSLAAMKGGPGGFLGSVFGGGTGKAKFAASNIATKQLQPQFARQAAAAGGAGMFGQMGAGLRARGGGSLAKGLAMRPEGMAAGVIAPAAVAAIGLALAGPISEILGGVRGKIEEIEVGGKKTGVKGARGETFAGRVERGRNKGAIQGASVGAGLGFMVAGLPGAIAGAVVTGIGGSILGEVQGRREALKTQNLFGLDRASKKAADALAKFAEKAFITAEDIEVVTESTDELFRAMETQFQAGLAASGADPTIGALAMEGAPTSVIASTLATVTGIFATLGTNLLTAPFGEGSASDRLGVVSPDEQVGSGRGFFSQFVASLGEQVGRVGATLGFGTAEGNSREFGLGGEQSRRADQIAGGFTRIGKSMKLASIAIDPERSEKFGAAFADATQKVTESFVLGSRDTKEAIKDLNSAFATFDTGSASGDLDAISKALRQDKTLGEAGVKLADMMTQAFTMEIVAQAQKQQKSLGDTAGNALAGILKQAGAFDADMMGSAQGRAASREFALRQAAAISGGNNTEAFRGLQAAINNVFDASTESTVALGKQALQTGLIATLSNQATRAFDAMMASISKLTRVFEQMFGEFDRLVSNSENRIDSILSGNFDTRLPQRANPFENLDLNQLQSTGVTDDVRSGLAEIIGAGGAGAQGTLKGLEAAPAFAANIDALAKSVIQEAQDFRDRTGKAPTTESIISGFEKRLPEGIAGTNLGSTFLSELRQVLESNRQEGGGIGVDSLKKILQDEGAALEKFGGAVKKVTESNAKLFDITQKIAQRAFDAAQLFRQTQVRLRELDFKKLDIDKRLGEATGTRKGTLAEARKDIENQIGLLTGGAAGINVNALGQRQSDLRNDEAGILAALSQPGRSADEVLISRLADVRGKLKDNTDALKLLADDTTQLAAIQKEIANAERDQARDRGTFADTFGQLAQAQAAFRQGDAEGGKAIIQGLRQEFGAIEKLQQGMALGPQEAALFLSGALDDKLKLLGQSDEQIKESKNQAFGQADGVLKRGLFNLAGIDLRGAPFRLNRGEEIKQKKKTAQEIADEQKAAATKLQGDIIKATNLEFKGLQDATDELRTKFLLAGIAAGQLREEGLVEKRATSEFRKAEQAKLNQGGKFAFQAMETKREETGRMVQQGTDPRTGEPIMVPEMTNTLDKRFFEVKIPTISDVTDQRQFENFNNSIDATIVALEGAKRKIDLNAAGTSEDPTDPEARVSNKTLARGHALRIDDQIKELRDRKKLAADTRKNVITEQSNQYKRDIAAIKEKHRNQAAAISEQRKAQAQAAGVGRTAVPVGAGGGAMLAPNKPAANPAHRGGVIAGLTREAGRTLNATEAAAALEMTKKVGAEGGGGGGGDLGAVVAGGLVDGIAQDINNNFGLDANTDFSKFAVGGDTEGREKLMKASINSSKLFFEGRDFDPLSLRGGMATRENPLSRTLGSGPRAVGFGSDVSRIMKETVSDKAGVLSLGRTKSLKAFENINAQVAKMEAITKKRGGDVDPRFAQRLEALKTRRSTLRGNLFPEGMEAVPKGLAPPAPKVDPVEQQRNQAMNNLGGALNNMPRAIDMKMADANINVNISDNNMVGKLANSIKAIVLQEARPLIDDAIAKLADQTASEYPSA